jgi:hypothetical protein
MNATPASRRLIKPQRSASKPRSRFGAIALAVGILACSAKEEGEGDDGTLERDSTDDTSSNAEGNNNNNNNNNTPNTTPSEILDEDDVIAVPTTTPVTAGDGGIPGFVTVSENCAALTQTPEQLRSPVDIIIVIDNSSSMAGEIEQVQERINEDFARIIEESGVDYRVIMVSRYGDVDISVGESDHPICIRAPLGSSDCLSPETIPLLHNGPRFFHYSADIRSRTPWCDLLETWETADEYTPADREERSWESIAPIGWKQFVREEAFKEFLVITDDNSRCEGVGHYFEDGNVSEAQSSAVEFDTALLALAPRQFGSNNARRYKWHSIVGMTENDNALEPWAASEPLQNGQCSPGSEGPGLGFQALSVLTGGLRYPSCNNDDFDAVFRALAEGVVTGSLACEWEIPEVEDFDADQVNVQWRSSSGSQAFSNVDSLTDCEDGHGWYYDDNENPTKVLVCPTTCTLLQSDPNAQLELLFGCETVRTRGAAR